MISCILLNYNGERFLSSCLRSFLKADYPDKEIIFFDNASTDDSVAFVKKHFPQVRVVVNKKNTGYAGGANAAIKASRGEYVLIANPDILMEPDFLKKAVAVFKDAKVAAVSGKLRWWNFEKNKKSEILDSTGLVMYRSRRCVDRGQGEVDEGQYDSAEEVFGVPGACGLYRRAALEKCAVFGEIFDEDFFMYKEDVDLAWRLRLAGWKAFYQPSAVAYHARGTGIFDREKIHSVVKNRKHLSKFTRMLSYRNERLMRVKNETLAGFVRDILPIIAKEILAFGWMIVREQFLFKTLFDFTRKIPSALGKRRAVQKMRKISVAQMRKWFV